MTWTVNRYIAKPRAVDARVLPIDPAGQNMLAQVVVKLDTEQVRISRDRNTRHWLADSSVGRL